MQDPSITIKPITDLDGCRHFQEVQRRIWSSDDLDLIPLHVLITMAKNGSVFLGAYTPAGPAETGQMVGFVLGWLGAVTGDPATQTPPRLKHCSHIAGVLPGWQGHGVGVRLKLAQREAVLAQGLTDHVTWTYDPLYRVNGAFNIHRLGAICATYVRNIYGDMPDALNAGVPTDRCQVDWHLRSPRVLQAVAAESAGPLSQTNARPQWDSANLHFLPVTIPPDGLPRPAPVAPNFDGTVIALPLPDDVRAIRKLDQELLLEWRLFLRDVLEQAFAAGYVLVDCVSFAERGWHYILTPSAGEG
jgi:predicted GNAT superfamily acetyltransferase